MLRSIKAFVGNILYRATGNDKLVDAEWNVNFHKLPSKKDWKMLFVFFIIVLLFFSVMLLFPKMLE